MVVNFLFAPSAQSAALFNGKQSGASQTYPYFYCWVWTPMVHQNNGYGKAPLFMLGIMKYINIKQ